MRNQVQIGPVQVLMTLSWSNGASGFGYADGDDATLIPNGTLSVYLRKSFNLTNVADIISLILRVLTTMMLLWLTSTALKSHVPILMEYPTYNVSTNQDHEAQMYNGGSPDRFLVSDFSSILVDGTNVLAIQAHNVSSFSSDFTIIPFLSAIYSTANSSGVNPPEILNLTDNNTLHTNFKISTTSETLTLSDQNGSLVDQLLVEGLPPNTSIGVSNFSNTIVSYVNTTPDAQNDDEEFTGTIQNEVIFSENGGLKPSP